MIVAKKDNNGIGGMIKDYTQAFEDKICIITGGDGGGGKTYYCDFKFAATSFVMICDFINEYENIDKYAKFYISVILSERLFKTIGHGRTISGIPNQISIKLPFTKKNKPDFTYMSNFIQTLPVAQWL